MHTPEPSLAAEHFAFLVVGRSIDKALFFGGRETLAEINVDRAVTAAVQAFLRAYGTQR
ncbi:hypothetical protein C6A85_000000104330 [Mycobacterium sp. ITM-2017-0098]|nr:hypothetical protein C6A85_000000104330 [Mycobacterium sp. ITM-2017-0098]